MRKREKCCAPTEFVIDWLYNRTESPGRMDTQTATLTGKRIEPDQNRSPSRDRGPQPGELCVRRSGVYQCGKLLTCGYVGHLDRLAEVEVVVDEGFGLLIGDLLRPTTTAGLL